MLEFTRSADPDSLNIKRKGEFLGYLNWHKDKPRQVVMPETFSQLNLDELKQCVEKLSMETTTET